MGCWEIRVVAAHDETGGPTAALECCGMAAIRVAIAAVHSSVVSVQAAPGRIAVVRSRAQLSM